MPPLFLVEAIGIVQEGLELGVGDGIAGDPESVQRLVLLVLVSPGAVVGDRDPLDVGQAVLYAHEGARAMAGEGVAAQQPAGDVALLGGETRVVVARMSRKAFWAASQMVL